MEIKGMSLAFKRWPNSVTAGDSPEKETMMNKSSFRQRMDEIAEFFPRRHIVDQNIVVEKEAFQFLNDVILHIARRIGKNPIGFMDERTGPVKVKTADLIDGLSIKSVQLPTYWYHTRQQGPVPV